MGYKKVLLILIFLACLTGSAQATDYYVNTTGNNSAAGTLEAPWATPAYAATRVVAGDTIFVGEGTYPNQRVDFTNNGTSGNPITIKAYNSEKPVLNSSSIVTSSSIDLSYAEWITVDGIIVYNPGRAITLQHSRNLTVINSTFGALDEMDGSIKFLIGYTCHDILVDNCDIYKCKWNGIIIQGVGEAQEGNNNFLKTTNITLRNSKIHDFNYHNCIDLAGNSDNITIENNTVYNSTWSGVYSHNGIDIQTNVTINNNTFINCSDGMKLETTRNSTISNNTMINIGYKGITTVKESHNLTIRDNTIGSVNDPIDCGVRDNILLRNLFTGPSTVLRSNYGGPIYTVDHRGSFSYTCGAQWNTTGILRYTDGRVTTHSAPQSGRYVTYTPLVIYTPTGSYWAMTSLNGFSAYVGTTVYNYSAMPETSNATVIPGTLQGNETVRFTANSTDGNKVNFLVWDRIPDRQYYLKIDGVLDQVLVANSTGYLAFNHSSWSTHTFTVELSQYDLPEANFISNVTTGKNPLIVQFIDTSTNSPTSWSWDLDGNGIEDSTVQNPVYKYKTPGNYTPSLRVSVGAIHDTETKNNYITVSKLPYVVFKIYNWFGWTVPFLGGDLIGY